MSHPTSKIVRAAQPRKSGIVEQGSVHFDAFLKQGKEKIEDAKQRLREFEDKLEKYEENYKLMCDQQTKRRFQLKIGRFDVLIEGWDFAGLDRTINSSISERNLNRQLPSTGRILIERSFEESKKPRRKLGCGCVSPREVELQCSHSVCARCFQEEVLNHIQNHNFSIKSVKCPTCFTPISDDNLFDVFGGKASFYGRFEDRLLSNENTRRSKFLCKICTDIKKVEGSMTLDCDHRFCYECMKEFLTDIIHNNKFRETDFVCPSQSCKQLISEETIKYCLDAPQYDRLSEFRLRNLKGLDSQEQLKKCPSSKCDFKAFIPNDLKYFDCPKCIVRYCLLCKATYRTGHKCNINRMMQAEAAKLSEERKMLLASGGKQCPKCKEGLFKEAGCNFMKCPSAACNNKTFFCWLCNRILKSEDHYDHFQNGPYGDVCKGPQARNISITPQTKAGVRVKRNHSAGP